MPPDASPSRMAEPGFRQATAPRRGGSFLHGRRIISLRSGRANFDAVHRLSRHRIDVRRFIMRRRLDAYGSAGRASLPLRRRHGNRHCRVLGPKVGLERLPAIWRRRYRQPESAGPVPGRPLAPNVPALRRAVVIAIRRSRSEYLPGRGRAKNSCRNGCHKSLPTVRRCGHRRGG